jgi:hypothetical protein
MESQHPYESYSSVYYYVEPSDNFAAVQYTITFDERTHTQKNRDFVGFCTDSTCSSYSHVYSGPSSDFPGVGDTAPLVITASSFMVHFIVDESTEFWGFKFTALAQTAPGTGWTCDNNSYAVGLCDSMSWTGKTVN